MRRSNGRIKKEQLSEIRDRIIKGQSTKLICYDLKVSEKELIKCFGDLINDLTLIKLQEASQILGHKILGHKDDTFSEEELLEFPNYSWEALTPIEKKFYINYGRKRNKRSGIAREYYIKD